MSGGSLSAAQMERYRPQINAIRRGLGTVLPLSALWLESWRGLERQVCGEAAVSAAALRELAVYGGGLTAASPVVLLFWQVGRGNAGARRLCSATLLQVVEAMDGAERAKLLEFVWGRSRLPRKETLALENIQFKIHPAARGPAALPQAHTCSFVLELPAYDSADIMRQARSRSLVLAPALMTQLTLSATPLRRGSCMPSGTALPSTRTMCDSDTATLCERRCWN
jgi:hypothetical protein